MTKGGKREGAGRPPAPPRPKPYSVRFKTQAQRDKFTRLGGPSWLHRKVDEAQEPVTSQH